MADLTDTQRAQAQIKPGWFKRFAKRAGLPRANLQHDLNQVYDVLEYMRGAGGIIIHKNDPKSVIIEFSEGAGGSGGSGSNSLNGYTEREDTIIDLRWYSDKIQIKTGTVYVKDETESEWLDKITFAEFRD